MKADSSSKAADSLVLSPQAPALTPALSLPLHGRYLIEASAGTGKTWTLTALLMRLLLERGVAARQIVATTFTRAASQELFERVSASIDAMRGSLRQLSEQAVSSELEQFAQPERQIIAGFVQRNELSVLNLRLERASRELSQMRINTLDGICQQWIREFALEAGLSEQLEIGDRSESVLEQIAHTQIRSFRAQLASDAPEVFGVMVASQRLVGLDQLRKARVLAALNNSLSIPVGGALDLSAEAVQNSLNRYLEQAKPLAAELVALKSWFEENKTGVKVGAPRTLQPAFELAERCVSRHEPIESRQALSVFAVLAKWWGFCASDELATKGILKGKLAKTPSQLLELPAYEAVRRVAGLAHAADQGMNQLENQLTTQIAVRAQRELPQRLAEQGLSSFSGEVRRLAQALSGPFGPRLAAAIRQNYPAILIDECQDINLDQRVLIERIVPVSLSKEAQQRLFLLLVGDPKQAIYRFRGADVRNYLALKAQFDAPAELLVNFRSSQRMIDALNTFFAHAPVLSRGIEYRPVSAAQQHSDFTEWTALSWLAPSAEPDSGADPKMDCYQQVAQQTLQLLEQGKLEPSDVGVLVNTNKKIAPMIRAFEDLGIPAAGSARQKLFALPAARLLLLALSGIYEPRNTRWLRSVLVSDLFGLTLSELLEFEQSSKLDQWQMTTFAAHERWRRHGLWQAWQFFVEATGLYTHLLTQKQGAELISALSAMVRAMITQLAKQTPADQLKALGEWVAEPPSEDWALTPAQEGGVSVMTIHRSKGLEFTAVFAIGLDTQIKRNSSGLMHGVFTAQAAANLGVEQRLLAHPEPADRDELFVQQLEESRRLLYVALTRASELLYIVLDKPVGSLPKQCALGPWADHELPITQPNPSLKTYAKIAQLQAPAPEPLPTRLEFYAQGQSSFSRLAASLHAPEPAAQSKHSGEVADKLDTDAELGDLKRDELEEAPEQLSAESDQPLYSDTAQQAVQTNPSADQTFDASVLVDVAAFGFERGAQPGSFLHRVLEDAVPAGQITKAGTQFWLDQFGIRAPTKQPSRAAEAALYRLSAEQRINALSAWLLECMQASLPEGARLIDLSDSTLPELGFLMGVRQLRLTEFSQAVQQAITRQFPAATLPTAHSHGFEYLTGEIDAVYEHQGKYWVVDYKSNHLGESLTDYHTQSMAAAMSQHGYWLQAAIYATALHRFLRSRLPNYTQEQFGGVVYAFLRGMRAESDNGVLSVNFCWQDLERFDACLGGAR